MTVSRSETERRVRPANAETVAAGGDESPRAVGDQGRKPLTFTRVDAPHPRAGEALRLLELAEPDELPADGDDPAAFVFAAAGENPSLAPSQLQQQAHELSNWLRERRRELDRRETQQHALAARLEGERRAVRLWIAEEQATLAERQREAGESIQEARRQAVAIAHAQAAVDEQQRAAREQAEELTERRAALLAAEQRFEERRLEHQREVTAWRQRRLVVSRDDEVRRARRDELETILEGQLRGLTRQRELLESDDVRRRQAAEEERQRLAEKERELDAEAVRRRESCDRREAALELREASLAKVQLEVEAAHRRSLETRLVVEQVWSRLQGAAAPTAVTQAIAQARGEISAHIDQADEELTRDRQRLAELVARVKHQLAELQARRRRWQALRKDRERELDGQAQALIEKERSLSAQAETFAARESEWLAERHSLLAALRERLAE